MFRPVALCLALFAAVLVAHADDDRAPTSSNIVIDASDRAAIEQNMNRDVVIRGEITSAEWSRSGKVLNIDFKDTQESRLIAVIFERNRKAMDEAYNGDVARTISGAKVRIEGTLKPYGGREESKKGWPQIIIDRITQITIVEPAPTSQPS